MMFLFYVLVLVAVGIFVRIFWVPLMILGAIILGVLGLLVSAGVTALTLVFMEGIMSGRWPDGSFSTYFWYSLVFYIVFYVVYTCIISDILGAGLIFLRDIFNRK